MGEKHTIPRWWPWSLPWGLSLGLHAALILGAAFLVWTTIAQPAQQIVPNVSLAAAPTPAATMLLDPGEGASHRPGQQNPANHQTPQGSALNAKVALNVGIIGLTGQADTAASPFAIDNSQTRPLGTSFFGAKGNARRIVFVVDASGSLIDTLPFVLQELQNTIEHLSPAQYFTVIFFRGANIYPHHSVIQAPPTGMKQATAATRQRVIAWLDPAAHHVEPGGDTQPLPALRQAIKYHPQLIYLLSDNITGSGQYQVNQRRLLRQIAKVNTIHAKINTIQFLYPDPLASIPGHEGTMKLIAQQTAGHYKFVTAKQLGLP